MSTHRTRATVSPRPIDGGARSAIVPLALLLAASALFGGCAQDLPRLIRLDTAFSDGEIAAVRNAIAEWNAVCRKRLSESRPCLVEGDRVSGDFSPENFSDGHHVVYRLERPDEGGGPGSPLDYSTSGYGTLEDVLLRTFKYLEGRVCGLDADDWPWTSRRPLPGDLSHGLGQMPPLGTAGGDLCRPVDQADYLDWLRHLALHELGHFLGMMHFEHRPGVMNKEDGSGHHEHLTEADIEQFCLVYECR
jgi:hypothetical protein